MPTLDTYANYLRDLGPLLKELFLEAKASYQAAMDEGQKAFESGKLMGLCVAISLVRQQASTFEIPLSEIGLGDFEPEKELL